MLPRHRRIVSVSALLVVIALVVSAIVTTHRVSVPAHAAPVPIGFGPTTVVDNQRLGGEPDVKTCGPGTIPSTSTQWSYANCGLDNPYASMPWGFSTTSSFVWRSQDQGQTFKLTPSNNGEVGKPTLCPGGGDTDLGVSPGTDQAHDYLNFVDLQGLTNFSSAVSPNGGQNWTGTAVNPPPDSCNPATSDSAGVDRQWFGFYKDPKGAPGNGAKVFLDYDFAVPRPGATTDCGTTPTSYPGNEFVVQPSTDGGRTFGTHVAVDCNDGIAGNIETNQASGTIYAIHTAYTATTSSGTTTYAPNSDAVFVNRSTDAGVTWTRTCVYPSVHVGTSANPCQPTIPSSGDVTTGQDFAVMAIDTSGNLYAVWSQAPIDSGGNIVGPSHIYYSYSSNNGDDWSPERQVDAGATTNVDLFPWIAAGSPNHIDVVWYGTTSATCTGGTPTVCAPGSQTTDWFPYFTQSTNADGTASTVFSTPVKVAQHANHNGGICTMGIGCSTAVTCATPGDRSLADFFQVAVNKSGGADVIWADTSNNSGSCNNQAALVDEARQVSGPSLFTTGTVSGHAGASCSAVGSTPCQGDQTGDAKYEANGMVGTPTCANCNVPNLDIKGSSVNIDPANHSNLLVRMKIADLTSLPTSGEAGVGPNDAVIDYLTAWNYHKPGGNQSTFDSTGNVYYAYYEVNTTPGASPATAAYAGNTCATSTTHGKYLVYPGQTAIPTANIKIDHTAGTIDLSVPLSAVGSPSPTSSATNTLYSVTAHTVGQPAPANGACTRDANGNSQDPTGQIFDVYDKSPAYTAVLATPTWAALNRASAHRTGASVVFHWRTSAGRQPLGFNVLGVRHSRMIRLNRTPIAHHAGRNYAFAARPTWRVRRFYIEALTANGALRFGPYSVAG